MSGNLRIPAFAVAVAASVLLSAHAARGELPYRMVGASVRALGMGDAVQALGLGTAGLYYNPACMSQIRQYSIDAGYGFQNPTAAHDLHISLVDSQTNPDFAMGASYTLSKSRRTLNLIPEGFTIHDVRAGISGTVGTEGFQFSIGGTFRYLSVSGDELTSPFSESVRAGRDPQTLAADELIEVTTRKADPVSMATFDVGILMNIGDLVYIGAAGQNLVTWSRHWAPRLLGVGIGFMHEMLDVGASVEVDFDSRDSIQASPSVGIEYVAGGVVAIRSGFVWDRVTYPQQYRVTAGLGYISQYIGVDVGYAHDVARKENWQVSASIRGFLP